MWSVMDRMITLVTSDKNPIYAPTRLGKTQYLTPEGYLVCTDVNIARTGEQRYHSSELPLEPDGAGEITVVRTPEEVFSPQTMASFEGKSITVEHPNIFVNPTNWRQFEVGLVTNVHRGEGIEDDMLMADLLIKDAAAIAHARKDRPEVSCGYDAEYEQTEPGRAFQRSIIGNHVALVDRGRAGPRCAIRDHQPASVFPFPQKEFHFMSSKSVRVAFMDRLARIRAAFIAQDAEAMKRELATADSMPDDDDPNDKKTQDQVTDKQIEDALDRIMTRRAKDAADKAAADKAARDAWEKEEEEKKKAADAILSAEPAPAAPDLGVRLTGTNLTGDALAEALRVMYSRAEVLSPGISVPTGDSLKAKDAMPNMMLAALRKAYGTTDGKAVVDTFLLGGQTIDSLNADNVLSVFNGAAELMRARNNAAAKPAGVLTTKDFSRPAEVATLAENNKKFWAGRS